MSGEMVRWRWCLVLAMLLLLPTRIGSKLDDADDDEERGDEGEEEDEEEEEEDDEDQAEKPEHTAGRRAPAIPPPTTRVVTVTRTSKRRPLECYVCAFKTDTPLRSCLDPTKYRVHTITCHSVEDKCFTSVISKGNTYETVVRGCRSGCVGTPEITCCELNRCNNQAFALPVTLPRVLTSSKSNKNVQHNVLFFVTILLLLQTVVKVAFV